MSSHNAIVEKATVDRRTFSYRKGAVNLEFTLDLGLKSQAKDFLDLLLEASIDLQKTISKMKDPKTPTSA